MKINLNIEANTPGELKELLANLAEFNPKVKSVPAQEKKETQKAEDKKVPVTKTAAKKQEAPQKSTTTGKYPDATKENVQEAMKKAMGEGHREAIKTAFSRFNAEKISDLQEEDYSAFITDLESLTAGE